MNPFSKQVENTIPVLPVRDLARSITFYTETLGFQLDWGGGEGSLICSVSRNGCSIILSQLQEFVSPSWVWIGLKNDSLFKTYIKKGVKVLQGPKNFSWAYEMKFLDVDENVLWLGTEPQKDLPLEDA